MLMPRIVRKPPLPPLGKVLRTEADVRRYLKSWVEKHKADPNYIEVSWEDLEEDLPFRNPNADDMADLNVRWAEVVENPSLFDKAVRDLVPNLRLEKKQLMIPAQPDFFGPDANWRRGPKGLMEDIGKDIGDKYFAAENKRLAEPATPEELARKATGKGVGPAYERYLEKAKRLIESQMRAKEESPFDLWDDTKRGPEFIKKFERVLDEAGRVDAPHFMRKRYIARLTRLLNVDHELHDDFGDPDKRIKEIQEKAYRYVFDPEERKKQDRDQEIYKEEHFGPVENEDQRIRWKQLEMRNKHRAEENRHKKWQDKYLGGFGGDGGNWSNPASWEDGWIED